MRNHSLEQAVFDIHDLTSFEEAAMRVFEFQYENVVCYRNFCNQIKRNNPKEFNEIPFLPISFFKSHQILAQGLAPELVFKSSGTTQQIRSQHFIPFKSLYERSFLLTYVDFFGPLEDQVVLALLPNYLEQGDSSLVYMVDYLIRATGNEKSGFYLNNLDELIQRLTDLRKGSKKVILFGVSYALMDLAEQRIDLSGITVIETGGMKGRRKELTKEELHEHLKKGLNVNQINAEYGMTELLSQAYLREDLWFATPKWMDVRIRDVNDPFNFIQEEKTGGVNVIDLANIYSCSFIATDDLGQKKGELFKILGRFDVSDIRGCNLLVN